MKCIAVIPARYASTRLPFKLMQDLVGQTVILRTYQAALHTNLFSDVFVVTDSEIIFNEIINHKGKAILSKKNHESGSDRIAEAIENIDTDIVFNIQGDEPFIQKNQLEPIINAFKKDTNKSIDVVSLMMKISNKEEINNPNNVKVVVDNLSNALYFSRSAIPFLRDNDIIPNYYKHIGIYAYRKDALLAFSKMNPTILEQSEKLEQLRYLESGKRIRMIETSQTTIGIDTYEDLEKARDYLKNKKNEQL